MSVVTTTREDFIPVDPPTFINDEIKAQCRYLLSNVDHDGQPKRRQSFLLIGETGVGKNTLMRELTAELQIGYRRFPIHVGTTNDEVVGKVLLNENGTYFVEGILADGMKKGYMVMLDELNFARAEVLASINSVMDNDRILVVAENHGEVIHPHPDFCLVGAMNPGYAGTKNLNKAFMSRFDAVIELTYLPEEDEIKLLMDRVPGISRASAMAKVKVIQRVRSQQDTHTSVPASFRELENWARLEQGLGDQHTAFVLTVVNKAAPDERDALFEAYATIAGR